MLLKHHESVNVGVMLARCYLFFGCRYVHTDSVPDLQEIVFLFKRSKDVGFFVTHCQYELDH